MEVQEKVAIVTGASGGIGLAAARLFAERGARVALVARSAERIAQLDPESPAFTLFTVGYQSHTIETFLDLLLGNGIQHVIDVRQLPFSRKPDFSKKRLTAHLETAGIGYTHLVELGTPKPLRDEVRRSHDYPAFFAAMDALVAEQPAALEAVIAIAQADRAALLCFESNADECHRRSVSRAIERLAGARCRVVDL